MNYKFWSNYDFIPKNSAISLDKRLKNVVDRMENFFKNALKKSFDDEFVEFYLAGSCLKRDTFRDIDLFFKTKDELENALSCIDDKYFLYKNNSHTFEFENDVFQCVYRERFLGKDLNFIVDIFDFSSTKIGFKCRLNSKTRKVEIVESDIRETFIEYLKNRRNMISRINQNPFVSLQRAVRFTKSGDNVPFSTYLNIILEINKIDPDINYDLYFQRLQGDDQNYEEIKEAIEIFLEQKKQLKQDL